MNKKEILGIDLGNTIITKVDGVKRAHENALRVIARLVAERFGRNSYIISRVTPEQKIRAQKWLTESGFHRLTGLPEDHVEWCTERHEKAPIAKRLGITHFIDDRPSVLVHMAGIVPHRFLFQGDLAEAEKLQPALGEITALQSWLEVESQLLP